MRSNKFQDYKLGELVDISSSKRIYAKEYLEYGIPFYRGKEIIEKHKGNDISTELYISEERYNELKEKFGVPNEGDILLTSVGTLGVPYLVKNEEFYFKDGNLTWFKSFNEKCNNNFIYYWLQSPFAKEQIYNKSIGSTQKALTIDTLKKFDIKLPCLKEQKIMVSILNSLDRKIELNNEMNKTLEEMAQALFKRWFVDFEFPNEYGEPYKSSGGEMVESELGMIPKGWKIGCLSDLVNIKYGKDHKKLEDGDVPVYGSGGVMRYVNKALYEKESVLIPRKGTLNNVMYVNKPFWSVDTMFFTEMKLNNIAKFVYQFVKSKDLAMMNIGSAVPSMTTAILNAMQVVIPSSIILKQFDDIITSLYKKIEFNKNNSLSLENTRNSLLPKLMSGEIRVEDIEANL